LAKIEARFRSFHPTESRRLILEQENRIEDDLSQYRLGGGSDENVLRAIFELMLPMTVKQYAQKEKEMYAFRRSKRAMSRKIEEEEEDPKEDKKIVVSSQQGSQGGLQKAPF
jgi:hypothetical protein